MVRSFLFLVCFVKQNLQYAFLAISDKRSKVYLVTVQLLEQKTIDLKNYYGWRSFPMKVLYFNSSNLLSKSHI